MTEFVASYATTDGREYRFYVYQRGDGSVRDNNHVTEIIERFTRDGVIMSEPPRGAHEAFTMKLGVTDTRRGDSVYCNWDYAQRQPCPREVAEAGMDVYRQIKHVLRSAKKEQGGKYGLRRLA